MPIAVLVDGVEQEPTWYCREIAPCMERQAAQLAEKDREGPGQPGKNAGEQDGLTGPGPETDFSSPASPLPAGGAA